MFAAGQPVTTFHNAPPRLRTSHRQRRLGLRFRSAGSSPALLRLPELWTPRGRTGDPDAAECTSASEGGSARTNHLLFLPNVCPFHSFLSPRPSSPRSAWVPAVDGKHSSYDLWCLVHGQCCATQVGSNAVRNLTKTGKSAAEKFSRLCSAAFAISASLLSPWTDS